MKKFKSNPNAVKTYLFKSKKQGEVKIAMFFLNGWSASVMSQWECYMLLVPACSVEMAEVDYIQVNNRRCWKRRLKWKQHRSGSSFFFISI